MKEFEVKILLETLSDITRLLSEMRGDLHYLSEHLRWVERTRKAELEARARAFDRPFP